LPATTASTRYRRRASTTCRGRAHAADSIRRGQWRRMANEGKSRGEREQQRNDVQAERLPPEGDADDGINQAKEDCMRRNGPEVACRRSNSPIERIFGGSGRGSVGRMMSVCAMVGPPERASAHIDGTMSGRELNRRPRSRGRDPDASTFSDRTVPCRRKSLLPARLSPTPQAGEHPLARAAGRCASGVSPAPPSRSRRHSRARRTGAARRS